MTNTKINAKCECVTPGGYMKVRKPANRISQLPSPQSLHQ